MLRGGPWVGDPWVGGGDGKIIPPVWLSDLLSKGEAGVVLLFRQVKFMKGNHVTSQEEGVKLVHMIHLANTFPGLPSRPCPSIILRNFPPSCPPEQA